MTATSQQVSGYPLFFCLISSEIAFIIIVLPTHYEREGYQLDEQTSRLIPQNIVSSMTFLYSLEKVNLESYTIEKTEA